MIIDIHTHVFPSHLAKIALHKMTKQIEENYESYRVRFKPRADGTVSDLLKTMKESGCTHSVLCPVITNAKSTKKTNDFSCSQKSEQLIPFASLLPTENNWESVIENIAEQGFKGIKLHPEFQQFDIDSKRSIEVVRKAEALGLVIIFHTGKDPCYPPPVHSTPTQMARLLDKVDGQRIVATHLGGWKEWEDVERYLSDAPIYFDTACIAEFINAEYCKHIMRKHGTNKIVFGSDYPWRTSSDTLYFIQSLELTEKEVNQICWENAKQLLGNLIT